MRIKVTEAEKATFEELALEEQALKSEFANFLDYIVEKRKDLLTRSKQNWDQIKEAKGLEGELRYVDGWLEPFVPSASEGGGPEQIPAGPQGGPQEAPRQVGLAQE